MTENALRTACLLLAVALVVWTNLRVTRDWPRWDRRERVVRSHLNALIFIVALNLTIALTAGGLMFRLSMVLGWEVSLLCWLYVSRHDPATKKR